MKQPRVIETREHGILPDMQTDSGPALRYLLSHRIGKGPVRLVLAPGRYDFFAEHCDDRNYTLSNTEFVNPRHCAIVLSGLEDLHLDLSGVDLRFHGRLMPIVIDNCRRVTITGGTLDWDFPLTAQAAVITASCDHIDLQIDTGRYPFIIEDGRLVFTAEGWRSPLWGIVEFDPQTGHIPPLCGDRSPGADLRYVKAHNFGNGFVRLSGAFMHPPRSGHILVLRHSPRDHAGVFIINSADVAIKNLTVNHTSGLGILGQHSENLEFSQVSVIPSSGRSFSGHDDGIHISGCKGHVQIIGCRFAGLMDDPVNVHGTAVRIIEQRAPDRLHCRFMHHESVGLTFAQVGDAVSFLDRTSLVSHGTATVAEMKMVDLFCFDITFDRSVPPQTVIGDALENLTWTPDLTIRDSFFGCGRARGLLVSTPGRVLIEGNRFESSGSAILIAGDANNWYESGAVRDVLIKGNYFADICNSSEYQFTEGIISIFPEVAFPDPLHPFHRNIRIEGNEFHTCEIPVLYAFSVDGLRFTDNRIHHSDRFEPRLSHTHMIMHEHDWGDNQQHFITLDHCRQVVIAENFCDPLIPEPKIYLLKTPAGELSGNSKLNSV